MSESIKAIDAHSIHSITSGQVVIDLQTAVKELVENSLDAGATSIDVRFQNYGLKSIEIVDNGAGIAPKDHDSIALKHYTSKLSSFEDLSRVLTFGFRGEALSSLCALTNGFTVTTATCSEAPMGTAIEMDSNGSVRSKCKIARQRGTTVSVSNLFHSLPVRRKEFERNAKREFQKALTLLHAYALVPCALENKGVRFSVSHQTEGGRKAVLFKTEGSPSIRASVTAIWGPKALENIVDLDLSFDVETEKSILRRALPETDPASPVVPVTPVKFQGLISKFAVGTGRTTVDRQFFFVNGRPYNPGKVQKAMNEVYRTFNVNQSPFVVANVILPTNACDINISPDKRTIFLHSEKNLVEALKTALETAFSSARSTYDVSSTQLSQTQTQAPQQNAQQTMSHGKPPMIQTRNQGHDSGENGSQHPTTRPLRGRTASHATQLGSQKTTGSVDKPISMGVPRLLVDDDEVGDDSEREPEPTLVARPEPKDTGLDGMGKTHNALINRSGSRTPSEPLFFPQFDDEQEDNVARNFDKGRQRKSVPSGRNDDPVQASGTTPSTATNATSSTSRSTPAATPPGIPRSSTHGISSKPRSVQTVLNTRGAAWNIQRDGNRDEEAGRERRQARISISSDSSRVRGDKQSFRSTLSQFLSTSGGSKVVPDARGEESGDESVRDGERDLGKRKRRDGSDEEEDELDETDEDEGRDQTRQGGRARPRPRPRTGDRLPQGTVVADDECAMGVDESPFTATKSTPSLAPQTSMGDDANEMEEDWGFSSTLVGTFDVPPAGKAVEAPSPTRMRPLSQGDTDSVTLRVDLINIGTHYLDMYNRLSSSSPSVPPAPGSTFYSAISSANLDTAAEDAVASAALSRIISKSDFERMDVVGQFNLGFILVRKCGVCIDASAAPTNTMDDLFIVDQHAADEKWNFETLQESTVIASQKLFRPRELHFTAADEMLAIENMDVLKRNGFELEQVEERETTMTEGDDGSETEGVRVRLRLVAQPMSKDTVFDVKDLEELIHLLQDRPRGTMVRCSKARAMFAMRACRRSVMVGTALDKPRMTAIVRHMGMMDQPWNCPHGRPTMRHLSDMRSFGGYVQPMARRDVEWEAYGRHGGG